MVEDYLVSLTLTPLTVCMAHSYLPTYLAYLTNNNKEKYINAWLQLQANRYLLR